MLNISSVSKFRRIIIVADDQDALSYIDAEHLNTGGNVGHEFFGFVVHDIYYLESEFFLLFKFDLQYNAAVRLAKNGFATIFPSSIFTCSYLQRYELFKTFSNTE